MRVLRAKCGSRLILYYDEREIFRLRAVGIGGAPEADSGTEPAVQAQRRGRSGSAATESPTRGTAKPDRADCPDYFGFYFSCFRRPANARM